MESLYKKLREYQSKDIYPMHMPGHKRNTELCSMPNPYSMDITEIDGFDDLHEAEECIKESMELAAKLYHSENTFYLVNGSTVGILSAIAAATNKGDKVMVARNCHKAVYHALYLNELTPVYLYPEFMEEFGFFGGVSVEEIKNTLKEHEDVKLIILTSPTYEGIVSDIREIADLAHEKGIPIMVDEAHGAHFGFSEYFPKSAVCEGADLVIQSLHKTMPSFTQTALLHSNGTLVDCNRVQKFLSIYQTSSPSYLLMGSMDQCMRLLEKESDSLFEAYSQKLDWFYEEMKQLEKIRILRKEDVRNEKKQYGFDWDSSKVIISVKNTNMTGIQLKDCLLHEYGLQMELVSKDYVLAMTSIGDTYKGFIRLADALLRIDQKLIRQDKEEKKSIYHTNPLLVKMNCYEVEKREGEVIPISMAAGRVSKEFVYLYPPGIPIIVPGEEITSELLFSMKVYKEAALTFRGVSDKTGDTILVVKR